MRQRSRLMLGWLIAVIGIAILMSTASPVLLSANNASWTAFDQPTPAPPTPPSPQQPAPPPGRPPSPTTPGNPAQPSTLEPPREPGQLTNIKVEVTMTDQAGNAKPTVKTLSVTVADRNSGFIRTRVDRYILGSYRQTPLNLDASPTIEGNKIRLGLTFNYESIDGPPGAAEIKDLNTMSQSQRLNLVLDDGKSMVVSQSADPVTDRRVTIEAKATILK